eukprot:Selendium_serpulae@DN5405_c0_g1_i3.p1
MGNLFTQCAGFAGVVDEAQEENNNNFHGEEPVRCTTTASEESERQCEVLPFWRKAEKPIRIARRMDEIKTVGRNERNAELKWLPRGDNFSLQKFLEYETSLGRPPNTQPFRYEGFPLKDGCVQFNLQYTINSHPIS